MGTWKSDGHDGKIFVGSKFEHSTRLPSISWIKRQVPIRELAELLGLKLHGKYIHCWHSEMHKNGDRTPSVGIDVRRNKVHCFVCSFDYSTIDLVMDVRGMTIREAAKWLASMWGGGDEIKQTYQVQERFKWTRGERKLCHQWSKLKPKDLKKRGKGYVEQLVGSRSWRTLHPGTAKLMLTLLTYTDPKTLMTNIATRDLAHQVGIRRSRVIRAARALEQCGMFACDTAYNKLTKKNKTMTYRLTWYSHAWQAWLKGRLTSTTTTKATCITVSQMNHTSMPTNLPVSPTLDGVSAGVVSIDPVCLEAPAGTTCFAL